MNVGALDRGETGVLRTKFRIGRGNQYLLIDVVSIPSQRSRNPDPSTVKRNWLRDYLVTVSPFHLPVVYVVRYLSTQGSSPHVALLRIENNTRVASPPTQLREDVGRRRLPDPPVAPDDDLEDHLATPPGPGRHLSSSLMPTESAYVHPSKHSFHPTPPTTTTDDEPGCSSAQDA
ncbi:hypothetical protein PM082_007943 [Marasmius tenuissimus]|nr:hypothetical protein PM082_007943 [Marasmius tenuissimus]